MTEARRAAEKAQAPRYAPEKWADASGLVDQAEEALTRKEFDAAGSRFADAERAFQEATALATTELQGAAAETRPGANGGAPGPGGAGA